MGFTVAATLGILLPSISSELDLSPGQQGMLASADFWGAFGLALPLSWWTSRYSPKLLTAVTLLLGTLLLLFQSWASAFSTLLLGRLGFGITTLAMLPAMPLLMRQWFRQREIILVNGVANIFFGVVVAGGLVLTPRILSGFGDEWRSVLYTFSALFGGLTLLWIVLGRERVTQESRRQETVREVGLVKAALSHRDLWVAGFGFLGTNMCRGAFLSFFPTLMLDTYQVSLQWSGAVLALTIFIGGFAGFGFSYLLANTDKRGGVLQVLGLVMAGTYVGMALAGSVPILIPLAILNGIAWGSFPILITVPYQLPGIRPREVAIAISFVTMTVSGGTALGPLVTGFLQEGLGDLRMALLILGFLGLSLTVSGRLRFGFGIRAGGVWSGTTPPSGVRIRLGGDEQAPHNAFTKFGRKAYNVGATRPSVDQDQSRIFTTGLLFSP